VFIIITKVLTMKDKILVGVISGLIVAGILAIFNSQTSTGDVDNVANEV